MSTFDFLNLFFEILWLSQVSVELSLNNVYVEGSSICFLARDSGPRDPKSDGARALGATDDGFRAAGTTNPR